MKKDWLSVSFNIANLSYRTIALLVSCMVGNWQLFAMTDVTKRHLTNEDFSKGPVTLVDIVTYASSTEGGTKVSGLQDINGWLKCIIKEGTDSPGDGMAGGIIEYGATNNFAVNDTPIIGPDGNTGYCLGFESCWTCGGYYYQEVTLPAGRYTIDIPVYNARGTNNFESYIGFLPDNGPSYVITGTPVVGEWTTLTTTFILSEETTGRIALGYISTNKGSSVQPHLFFDCVRISCEEWVDCTEYLQNPGFDEDISFNVDGSASKDVTFAYEWNNDDIGQSALVYKAADGSIYSVDKNGQQGFNAAGLPNWDGYKVCIKGWETTNKSDTAIWIYYGCIPYNLGAGMMKLGGGTNGIGDVTEKPSKINTDDNTGVLYLKAGWSNACTYKQTVKGLEQAKYHLSYYVRNTNVEKSRLYAEATNLCHVTCNGVSFVDNDGFNSRGWIKHSIEFIPVDSFSVEFGCRASNDYSYNNPILWVDGIKLYKISDASEEDVETAYYELVIKANSLVAGMHFAADKRSLQAELAAFEDNQDYVALYQAILAAEASEKKYVELMDEESMLQTVSRALATDMSYGGAKDIVRFAYDKVTAWIVSDDASYTDADDYIARLDAYANSYASAYVKAGQYVDTAEETMAERVRLLMESQKSSLMESDLLCTDVVEEYVQALMQAISSKGQTLDLTSLPAMTYGDDAYTLPEETTEGLTLTWTSSNTSVATISSGKLTIKGAGNATVTATQAGNDSYQPFSRQFALTVGKANLTITANSCEKTQGEENPELTVSYSGFKYSDTPASLTKQPTVSTTATKDSPAGIYPITVSGAESANYEFSYVNGTLTVTEMPDMPVPTDISQMDNAIYIKPFSARIGGEANIEICLKNAEAATAYVFDLVLPEGVTVAKNDKGKYIDALSDRHDDHTRTFNEKGNNTYSLSTLSGNSEELTGNDGAIRLLTLSVAEDLAEGVYAVEIKNASYSKPDGTLVPLPNTISTVTVEDYVPGDVNGNGGLDIGDAVTIVNYLVGKESTTFMEKAADTNKNGQIDIGDAVTIVNFLVGKTESLSRQSNMNWSEEEP